MSRDPKKRPMIVMEATLDEAQISAAITEYLEAQGYGVQSLTMQQTQEMVGIGPNERMEPGPFTCRAKVTRRDAGCTTTNEENK